jgi:2-dehydro-3-deoxyphosphooctonate aldolase (KDO 8-P synthase)
VKDDFGLPIITDVHETSDVNAVAEVANVLQIPAFLSRQTDLLLAAGKTGRAVNIKKGQFLAPTDMKFAVEKVNSQTPNRAFSTERGTTFGYGDLVVDFRSFPIMREYAPVVHDVTHSIQQPGALNGKSGGQSWLAPYLARAAVAVGVDGLFIETHPDPENALSDGPNMINLGSFSSLLQDLLFLNGKS